MLGPFGWAQLLAPLDCPSGRLALLDAYTLVVTRDEERGREWWALLPQGTPRVLQADSAGGSWPHMAPLAAPSFPSACAADSRGLRSLLERPHESPGGLSRVLLVGMGFFGGKDGGRLEERARARVQDPASGDFADLYLPLAAIQGLHLGLLLDLPLSPQSVLQNAGGRKYLKMQPGEVPRIAGFDPLLAQGAPRPAAEPRLFALAVAGPSSLCFRSWCRVRQVRRVELAVSPRTGRETVTVCAILDDGSTPVDAWLDGSAALQLMGLLRDDKRRRALRTAARDLGRVVLQECLEDTWSVPEDEQDEDGAAAEPTAGGRRYQSGSLVGSRRHFRVVEVGQEGTPGLLGVSKHPLNSRDGRAFPAHLRFFMLQAGILRALLDALTRFPRPLDRIHALYLYAGGAGYDPEPDRTRRVLLLLRGVARRTPPPPVMILVVGAGRYTWASRFCKPPPFSRRGSRSLDPGLSACM